MTALIALMPDGRRVLADTDKCEGHGLCESVAPEVYALDDDAVVYLTTETISPENVRRAEAGARACPVAALRIEATD